MPEPIKELTPHIGADELKHIRALANNAANRLRELRVAVVCGGDTAEREISLVSGNGIHEALLAEDIQSRLEDWKPTYNVNAIPCDVMFLALHGGAGEDGHIQAALDLIGKPYVSVGMLASAVGMHKPSFKVFVQGLGLNTPRWAVVYHASEIPAALEHFSKHSTFFIKPVSEGSSVGVMKAGAENASQAITSIINKYGCALIEEQLTGREVTASVMGLRGKQVVLPHVEIAPVKAEFYDYNAKYTKGETEYIIPARLNDEENRRLAKAAAKIQDALALFPYARIDAIIGEDGEPSFLEMNTLPGFTPLSLVPQAAASVGIGYGELLRLLIYLTMEAHAS